MKKLSISLLVLFVLSIFSVDVFALSENITIKFVSTRSDGRKFGPHIVTITPTQDGCMVTHSKGHKCIVDSCNLWKSIDFTIYEKGHNYWSKQSWKFTKSKGKIVMQGEWHDSNKDRGKDKGKSL